MRMFILLLIFWFPIKSVFAQIDTTQTRLMRYELKDFIRQEIDNEKTRIKDELQIELKAIRLAENELRSSMNTYVMIGSVLLGLLTFLGAASFWWLYRGLMRKLKAILDEAFYRVDPRYMPIKIPSSKMQKQSDTLRKLDFRYIETYEKPDQSCTHDAVIFMATSDEEAEVLKNFIEKENLKDRKDVVFVVYTKGTRIAPHIFSGYDNVTFANNHLTLVQALFVAARGIVR